jgi:PAS domain S-box-containing protein
MTAEEKLGLCPEILNLDSSLTEPQERQQDVNNKADGVMVDARCGEQMLSRRPEGDCAYRVIVETTMSEGAVTLSQDGTVVHCNSTFARLLCRPSQDIIGVRFADWVEVEFQTRYAALLATASGPCGTILHLVRADGIAVPVQLTASPLALADQPGVICMVVLDLTERQRLLSLEIEQQESRVREETLRERGEELEQLNAKLATANQQVMVLYAERNEQACQLQRSDAMKTRFLSYISHEFRSPLNSIFALTTLLLRRADGELTREQDEQVGLIRKAADSLLDLVNDLSNLAKVEAGEIEVHRSKFEAAELLGNLRGMLAAPLLAPTVRLVFEEAAGIPTLYSDEGKVSQILRNFIDNALKFTERGEVRVAASHDLENDVVIFSVRDTGIGMAPADQERIFDEFTQLKSPAQSRVNGMGLGLPLCRKLATLLGGRVTLESTLGAGSKFFLALPRCYAPANETPVGPDPGAELDRPRGTKTLAG